MEASTGEEVITAVKERKSGKAVGFDGMTDERVKAYETETPC